MYIKEIIIEGFRSFRDPTVIRNFDKHVNCVVGYNGSGKSNIFAAIEFVLSNEFSHLSAKERSYLLHRYSARIKSGRVKLVLDNTDRSLQAYDTDEVHITREITATHCKLKINDHVVTFKDLMTHMSAAGFIKAFAKYYMLKQGSITKLSMQSDAERLQLLYEITGTNDFLAECKEIDQQLNHFKSDAELYVMKVKHLRPLVERTKRDLNNYKKYKELLRKKTAATYFHNKKEYDIFKKELRDIETKYNTNDRITELKQKHTEMKEKVQKYSSELEKSKSELSKNRTTLNGSYSRMKDLNKRKKDIQLDIETNMVKRSLIEKRKLEAVEQISAFTRDLELTEAELDAVKPQLKIAKANAFKAQDEFSYHRSRQKYLEWKRQIILSNKTMEDRKNILARALSETKKSLKREEETERLARTNIVDRNVNDVNDLKAEQVHSANEYARLSNLIRQKLTILLKTNQKCAELQTQMQEIVSKKRALFDELSIVDDEFMLAKASYNNYILTELVIGNSMVNKMLAEARKMEDSAELIDGYCGTLIDLFDCSLECAEAAQLVGGEVLYSHVVKTADLAIRYVDIREKMNAPGEIRFLVLSEFKVRDSELPTLDSDYVPLLSELKYKPEFLPIISSIFGNAFRCINMDIINPPSEFQEQHTFVMQGNVLWDLDGTVTFGDSDPSMSSVALAKNCRDLLSKCSQITDNLRILDQEFDTHSEKQNKVFKLKENLRNDHYQLVMSIDTAFNQHLLSKEYMFNYDNRKSRFEEAYMKFCLDVKVLKERVSDMERCLEDDSRLAGFPDEEKTELVRLNERLPHLKRTAKKTANAYEELHKTQAHLNARCYDVRIHKEDARKVIDDSSFELYCPHHETNTERVAKAEYQISCIKTKVTKILQHIQDLNKRIAELQPLIFAEESGLHSIKKEMEHAWNERMKLNEKRSELKAKIAEQEKIIGEYPRDGNEYNNMSLEELKLTLINIEKELFQCSDRKWTEDSYDHEGIRAAISRIERSRSLEDSIETLETVYAKLKHQNIVLLQHQFANIAMNFERIFNRIAPGGSASLSLIQSTDAREDDVTLDSYLGVGLKATFDLTRGDLTHARTLSGGEKTMVAFAMVFSMFSNKNPPLFLLDEADSALSAANRNIIVDFIQEMSRTTQFFIITFRPELLSVAEKYFCTYVVAGCSHVKEIDREEASQIISHNDLERAQEFSN